MYTFQITAPVSPAPMTGTPWAGLTVTSLPTVLATAAPKRSGPSRLKTDAIKTAGSGRATRVATSVAIEFAASWNPFVRANANAMRIARTRVRSVMIAHPKWDS